MSDDLVYIIRHRPGNGGEELRYSLRSACENLAHGAVWMVGPARPHWLSDEVRFLRTTEKGEKWKNLPRAILAAASHDEISERFVLMNDDFFVMRPVRCEACSARTHYVGVEPCAACGGTGLGPMPVLHRGPLSETRGMKQGGGAYQRGYRETHRLMVEHFGLEGELLNYEVHAPLPMVRDDVRAVLERGIPLFKGRVLQTRTLYGNACKIGGTRTRDVKVFAGHTKVDPDQTFLSTNDYMFTDRRRGAGLAIRRAFAEPCRYERKV